VCIKCFSVFMKVYLCVCEMFLRVYEGVSRVFMKVYLCAYEVFLFFMKCFSVFMKCFSGFMKMYLSVYDEFFAIQYIKFRCVTTNCICVIILCVQLYLCL